MNKNLTAAILVPTKSRAQGVGSGYPIGPRVVLTAKHVIEPPDRDENRPIEVRLMNQSGSSWVPVEVAWSSDDALDVALLAAQGEIAPDLEPWSLLSPFPVKTSGPWESQGFPRVARQERTSVAPHSFGGEIRSCADESRCLELDVEVSPEDWRGMSGAPVFVSGRIVGVIRIEPTGFRGKRLVATPTSAFVDIPEFRKAAGLDERDRELRRLAEKIKASQKITANHLKGLRRVAPEISHREPTARCDAISRDRAPSRAVPG